MPLVLTVFSWIDYRLLGPFPDMVASLSPIFIFPLSGIMSADDVAAEYFLGINIGATIVAVRCCIVDATIS